MVAGDYAPHRPHGRAGAEGERSPGPGETRLLRTSNGCGRPIDEPVPVSNPRSRLPGAGSAVRRRKQGADPVAGPAADPAAARHRSAIRRGRRGSATVAPPKCAGHASGSRDGGSSPAPAESPPTRRSRHNGRAAPAEPEAAPPPWRRLASVPQPHAGVRAAALEKDSETGPGRIRAVGRFWQPDTPGDGACASTEPERRRPSLRRRPATACPARPRRSVAPASGRRRAHPGLHRPRAGRGGWHRSRHRHRRGPRAARRARNGSGTGPR